MAILNTLIASSAVALTLLAQAATPVNALAAPAHANHARNVSPNHNGMMKRKRTTHKNRKRCVAQQNLGNSNTGNNNNNNTPTSSASDSTYTPPATTNNNNGNSGNTASSTPCSKGKLGLAWSWDMSSAWLPTVATGRACWIYDWSAAPPSDNLSGLRYVPMFWGESYDHDQEFTNNVINSGTNYGYALAMNEVNQQGQADLDIYTGAAQWRQWLLPLRNSGKNYYLVSPSTTSAPDGLTWMQGWMNLLGDNEKPNAIALHWYGIGADTFKAYVQSFADAFPGYKLWITEFACTNFGDANEGCDTIAFAQSVIPWLESQSFVEAYFPFGWQANMSGVRDENRLIDTGSGQPTGLGWTYLTWGL